jgi:uncharacterized protein (TIGR00730 family)
MHAVTALCVYCGSRDGRHPLYLETARALGGALAERNIALVYGGARVGLMGAVASATLNAGGRAIGVLPAFMRDRELAHESLTELHITATMHERKAKMAELCDGFIALPGGIGTLEELFEAWTWAQIGVHAKPCALLNVAGYYDQLGAFLDHAFAEGFVRSSHHDMLIVDDNVNRLLDRVSSYEAPLAPSRAHIPPV